MDQDLANAEKARMTAFLNKGRSRTTAARLAALRDTNSDSYKQYQGVVAAAKGGSPERPGTAARTAALIGPNDLVGKPNVLAGGPEDRRSGPRTRFGDGDGSWWDRWLSFEPPRVSSYSNGFVAPLNGFKRDRMVAERGAWVDDPAHRRRLIPFHKPASVQAAFASTMLTKPPEMQDSDDSLDDDDSVSSSDESVESAHLAEAMSPPPATSLEILRDARSRLRDHTRIGGRANSLRNMGRSRSTQLPPLSPMNVTTPSHRASPRTPGRQLGTSRSSANMSLHSTMPSRVQALPLDAQEGRPKTAAGELEAPRRASYVHPCRLCCHICC